MKSSRLQGTVKPVYRLLEQDDLPEIVHLIEEFRPTFARLRSRVLYAAICRQALIDERLVFIIAEARGELIGFSIAIIDRNRFWISFLPRYPLLSVRIVFKVFLKPIRVGESVRTPGPEELEIIKEYIAPSHSGRSWWRDSSPRIAKGLYIAVAEKYRGKGIGRQLLRSRNRVLVERGVKRFDGITHLYNIPQIHLFHSEGFRIERKGKGGKLFVTIDLNQKEKP
jgi:GNAT superfamily N-acetyltransferase